MMIDTKRWLGRLRPSQRERIATMIRRAVQRFADGVNALVPIATTLATAGLTVADRIYPGAPQPRMAPEPATIPPGITPRQLRALIEGSQSHGYVIPRQPGLSAAEREVMIRRGWVKLGPSGFALTGDGIMMMERALTSRTPRWPGRSGG